MRRRHFLAAAALLPAVARAQTYPAKPIRVVLPGPASALIRRLEIKADGG